MAYTRQLSFVCYCPHALDCSHPHASYSGLACTRQLAYLVRAEGTRRKAHDRQLHCHHPHYPHWDASCRVHAIPLELAWGCEPSRT